MKTRNFVLLLLSLAVLAGCRKYDQPDNTYYANKQALDQMLQSEYENYLEKAPGYPGGLALKVIAQGKEYFLKAGMDGKDVTAQTRFRAASCTKTFTATAILLLHQQGKLRISDLITDTIPGTGQTYLPDVPECAIPHKSKITILDLLRHRAGVFDLGNDDIPDTVSVDVPYKGVNYISYVQYTEPDHTFHFDELVEVLARTRLSYFAPGSGYHYSNTGYSILGWIIERVSGMSYKEFLEENVLKPMGMYNSYMPVLGTDKIMTAPSVNGYLVLNGESFEIKEDNMSAYVAEGNIVTTPNDLARFLQMLLSGKGVLNYYTVNSLMMNCLPNGVATAGAYGCGLEYTNNLGYGNNGAHLGYLTYMIYDPPTGFTIVVYTNAWNFSDGIASISYQVTNMLQNICYRSKELVTKH